MAISAAAKSHHDQLFGDRVSALAQSDPELVEYFGNFAFDEVHADTSGRPRTRPARSSRRSGLPRAEPGPVRH